MSENGYNPEKAEDIEISNLINFVQWSRSEQPWLLMHEMAHAYHHRVLGAEFPAIEAAYKNAVDSGRYRFVQRTDGRVEQVYGISNSKEYFAKLTEAYLGRNDFYPFAHSDIALFDPVGFELMVSIWGD